MIGIIGAMEEEVAILKNKINALEEIKIAHVIFYKGQLEGKDIVLTQSGIGKVNVAISTTLLIEQFKPDLIINTGSAGALDKALNVGDVVVSDRVMYHDADARAFGYELGQIPQMPASFDSDSNLLQKATEAIKEQQLTAKIGLIVSGDSFIGTFEQRATIKENFKDALAAEMEATAIAQTCYQFNLPFIITRAISDLADGDAGITFDAFLEKAAISSSEIVERLIKSI
ncbi:5'-methylthioadenosine/S-adenosylhomocysteine nucleosidase [Staphylococcus gallinarum]|jgi:adenosylhomocysteine nucleosidase|uniref:5'-methylthioadenosine/S-adenosylhomocysteine nucleosidase n=2 Tax=Staphylococcus TaxID=1279 RepID=A0A0D0SRA8_STAGA|nr:5'-methylthioadenosine/S-adenosylhomocysteine nucleosidase [Staphylococcus gallinarum]KIR11729.1 5'-methylthioadenosine nucleosidase [Staphylococcus gallinarum]MBU7216797.1 5'-methylthioadenosine/S-adenosylhomocysteine nucleosidase [Staphylococcus gallinarum]MCD8793722.1 5'-methylthioadenosine/S-adenosylhomocysteine nucleosidase [Staphylococcus gallinarum]MCD8820023.1 5'-methylthioadenosine/S-adenosylhomocysteine nucleosidase [Staphylococcus gallinarum]MCD8825994.1 5'-methylthioadenosine/S-